MIEKPQASDYLFENESTQMAFSVAGSRRLGLLVDKPTGLVCDFLAHHIARKPQDLTVHVQRIKLAAQHELQPVLQGALLDLYIALGTRGYDLRQRMLKLASGVLSEDSIQYLTDRLLKGVEASDLIPDPGISVLCKSIVGSVNFIQASPAKSIPDQSPLEHALAYIECSQLENACEVLEDAIHSNASDVGQQALLLDLYRKTDSKKRFKAIYANLGEAELLDQQAWQALADFFNFDG